MTTALTFRVSCIPAEIPDLNLATFLVQVIPALVTADNVRIGSRAPSLEDFSYRHSSVATILIRDVPPCFQDGSDRWSFPVVGQVKDLIVDKHFEGFTPLNNVGHHHEFDCIAISGLASHPYGSWKSRKSSRPGADFMWLRDQLPKDSPSLRVMCYGYDSLLNGSDSFQTIDHLALNFAKQLVDMRVARNTSKPIIFLAHSLGGIILKGALVCLASGCDIYTSTLEAIKLVVLFGVPNTGMYTSHLRAMTKAQPNRQMVEDLSYSSPYLKSLDERFRNHSKLRDIKLLAAFETKTSATAVKNEYGEWVRTGPRKVLVPESSATAVMGLQSPNCFPINEDHSNMVKFSSSEIAYKSVLAAIIQATKEFSRLHQQNYSDFDNITALQANSNAWHTDSVHERQVSELNSHAPGDLASDLWLDLYHQNEVGLRCSLAFEEMDDREEDIMDAQDDTFSWITQDESLGFKTWLQMSHGLYWIRGKPGSGKSTLMKFMRKERHINDMLSFGHVGCQSIIVWFFFHERGSVLQKSYEGLLRSILLKILDSNEELAVEVMKIFILKAPTKRWSISKLEHALETIRKQNKSRIRITIFLDALDEYYGAPEIIASILQKLQVRDTSSTVDIKICFSSRPWDTFVKNFDHEPGFAIHDQTRGDARRYVERRFNESPKLIKIFSINSYQEAQDFVNNILRRAEGVFLWLRFVIDLIQVAVEEQGTEILDNLVDLISKLPDDLETYYRRSIERMPVGVRKKACMLLDILYRSMETLYVDQLYYAAICAQESTFEDSTEQLREAIRACISEDQMAQRLLNLCGGLIETFKSSHAGEMMFRRRLRVQFIHQTAKDFFAKPSSMEVFLGPASGFRFSREDGNTYLAKFWLTNNALLDEAPLDISQYRAAIYARESELTTGTHMGEFLESMNCKAFEGYDEPYTLQPSVWSIDGRSSIRHDVICDSPKTFGIYAHLQLYLQSSLNGIQGSLERLTPLGHMPLLHCAILNVNWDADAVSELNLFETKMDELRERRQPYIMDLLEPLIAGTQPKTEYKGYTAIQLCIRLLLPYLNADVRQLMGRVKQTFLPSPIVTMLLAARYNPDLSLSQDGKDIVRVLTHDEQYTDKTTLLHCALDIAQQLVEAGAELNALDGRGRTPLDFWFEILDGQLGNRGLWSPWNEIRDAIMVVARHGGVLTSRGDKYRRSYFARLESGTTDHLLLEQHPITDETLSEWKNIPVMPTIINSTLHEPTLVETKSSEPNSSRFKESLRKLLPRRRK